MAPTSKPPTSGDKNNVKLYPMFQFRRVTGSQSMITSSTSNGTASSSQSNMDQNHGKNNDNAFVDDDDDDDQDYDSEDDIPLMFFATANSSRWKSKNTGSKKRSRDSCQLQQEDEEGTVGRPSSFRAGPTTTHKMTNRHLGSVVTPHNKNLNNTTHSTGGTNNRSRQYDSNRPTKKVQVTNSKENTTTTTTINKTAMEPGDKIYATQSHRSQTANAPHQQNSEISTVSTATTTVHTTPLDDNNVNVVGDLNNNSPTTLAAVAAETTATATATTTKTMKKPNRIYSDSSMDYIPALSQAPAQAQSQATTNFLSRLVRRTTHGYLLPDMMSVSQQQEKPQKMFENRGSSSSSSSSRKISGGGESLLTGGIWPKKWSIPRWVSLLTAARNMHSHTSSDVVTHMAWDTMGVLLVVICGMTLNVYDWDMVMAADVMGRNEHSRSWQWRKKNCSRDDDDDDDDGGNGCSGDSSMWKLEPIVSFKLPHPVASLQWNQFDVDGNEIAVGFRSSGEVRIYNLDHVAQWLGRIQQSQSPASSSTSSTSRTRTPPSKTYRSLSIPRTNGSATAVHFINAEHVLVNLRDRVYCWRISSVAEDRDIDATDLSHHVYWRFHIPSSIVTSMASLGSNLVVMGTNKGQLCVVDWTQTNKERSFSASAGRRPIVVIQTWTPHTRFAAVQQGSRLRMGILHLAVETTFTSTSASKSVGGASNEPDKANKTRSGERHWGCCRIKWVNESGWLLSTTLESPSLRGTCKVHMTSPKIVYKNTDGEILDTASRPMYSLPQQPVGVDGGISSSTSPNPTIGWVSVPGITHVLPHHDKFVLDSQPTTIRSRERSILVSTNKIMVHNIPIPSSIRGLPKALAIHPNKEWIVVADGDGKKLHILCGRRECKFSTPIVRQTTTTTTTTSKQRCNTSDHDNEDGDQKTTTATAAANTTTTSD